MTMRIEPITDRNAFMEAWRRLYDHADAPSFYLSPAWVGAWTRSCPDGASLYQMIIEENGAPVLLGAIGLPARRPPLIGVRSAHFLECGDEALDAIYVEFNDFLIRKGEGGEELRRRAAKALFEKLTGADQFIFRNARPALCSAVIAAAEDAGLRAHPVNAQPAFECDLAAARRTDGDFLKTLKGSVCGQISRAVRLYRVRGELRIDVAETEIDRRLAFERIKDLHAKSWARRGRAGVYANAALSSFHERLMRASPEAVSLCTIFAGDEIIGGLHNFIHNDRVLNYQSGFRYEADNRMKPGLVSHALAAQYYLDAGYAVYDLLAGEARYKRSLSAVGESLSTVIAERDNPRIRFRAALKRVKTALSGSAKTRRT